MVNPPTIEGKELTPDEDGNFTYTHPTGNRIIMFADGSQELHHLSGVISKIEPCGKAKTYNQEGSLIHEAVAGSKYSISKDGEINFS